MDAKHEMQSKKRAQYLKQHADKLAREAQRHFERVIEAATQKLTAESADIETVQVAVGMLRSRRDKLKVEKNDDLPNLAKVRATRPDIAVAANALYAAVVLDDRNLAIRRLKEADISENVPAHFVRAMLQMDAGNLDQAEVAVDRILELDPGNFRARRFMLSIEEAREKGTTSPSNAQSREQTAN